ncbi:MAG: transglycosylase [Desulfobulbaceae bacterium]|nr:transglycosylase [Desulfobulbaceae bacterium]
MEYLRKMGGLLLVLVLAGWPGLGGAATRPAACRAVALDIRSVLGVDDLAGAGFEDGVATSLRYLAKLPASKTYNLCDRQVSVAELQVSLQELRQLWTVTGGGKEFLRRVADKYELLSVQVAGKEKKAMITGYFEPMLEGALVRDERFAQPLYVTPADLVQQDGEVGRLEGGKLVPYWTRAEIEDQNLLAGQELVYLDDPVEAFILQVQGSGRVRLRDGSVRRVQYAAKNGRPYRSIGKFLAERGAMSLKEVTLPSISAYLAAHPEQIKEVLHHNESYVFFRWGDSEQCGPKGCLGEPLVPDRSVALDRECFPPGAPALLLGRKPKFNAQDQIVGWAKMQRLVFSHDSGSAIRGPGRLDLFLGYGARARAGAGVLKGPGRLYFLLKKK